jgi:hypothetical protein
MELFSVYCNFSKIAISEGQDCVLIPLVDTFLNKDDRLSTFAANGIRNTCYHLLTLPIYGKYETFKLIEIERDANVQLIESVCKFDISTFCENFLGNPENVYCFVDRKVWDLLVSTITESGARWQLEKELAVNGKFAIGKLYELLGLDFQYYYDNSFLESFPVSKIQKEYLAQSKNNFFIDRLQQIDNALYNAWCFSEFLKPYECYVTPQGGRYKEHEIFLRGFAEINKSYI